MKKLFMFLLISISIFVNISFADSVKGISYDKNGVISIVIPQNNSPGKYDYLQYFVIVKVVKFDNISAIA